MGVISRGKKLRFRFKGPDGKWTNVRTDYLVGQEKEAEKAFEILINSISAGVEMFGPKAGPVTVQEYCDTRFYPTRRKLLEDWESDEGRLNIHILPAKVAGVSLGQMPLREVRARHLVHVFQQIRMGGKLAPKSIYNVYGVVKALFRDAKIDDLITDSPCVLDERHLGPNEDADPEWRDSAIFTRSELEQLISDPRIPADRQMLYAIQGIGATRHGEAAALRWKHWDPSTANSASGELGKLLIAKSHGNDHTKTKRGRTMPVHAALAAMLADWKLSGWPAMMGRPPTPEDLIVPMPAPMKGKGRRAQLGSRRTNGLSYKRLVKDLALLGMRHRWGHDLRRTFITLCQADGGLQNILEQCTHTPKKAKAIGGYTIYSWAQRSAEVAKLKLSRKRGQLLQLPKAVGASGAPSETEPVTPSLHQPSNHLVITEENTWRRRESNPRDPTPSEDNGAQSSAEHERKHKGLRRRQVDPGARQKGRDNGERNDVTSDRIDALLTQAVADWQRSSDGDALRRALHVILHAIDGNEGTR